MRRNYVWVMLSLAVLIFGAIPALADPGDGDLSQFGGFPGVALQPGPPGSPPPESPRASSTNIRLLAHIDPGGGFNADVVAHGGFAYLGSWGNSFGAGAFCPSQGVRVYSLHDPSNPTPVSTFAHGTEPGAVSLAGTWTEKVIVQHVNTPWFNGDLAAVSIQTCVAGSFRGFGLWDVTDPSNPQRLALYSAAGTNGSHEIWLEPRGNRAYVYTAIPFSELTTSPGAGVPGRADFHIVDVSDPTNPMDVGEWGAWRKLGLPPINPGPVTRVNFVHSVIGEGTRAYLSYWDLGTVILDVSDVTNPTLIGRTLFAANEEGNAHSAWLGTGGNLLIQTDEDFNPSPHPVLETSWGYARFFDIGNPANPVQLGTFKLPTTTQFPPPLGFFSVHDPKVRGGLAYLSSYSEGVVVVDISRPANPRFVAQFVPEPADDPRGFFAPPGVEFPFVWGTFVDRNDVLASDINSGLWIFQVI